MSCHVCEALQATDADRIVYEADGWVGYQLADVPGWTTLAPREHVEGPGELSAEQAAGFGPAVRVVGRILADVTGATRTHVVYLGETARHFHASLLPRSAGQAAVFTPDLLVAEIEHQGDPSRAAEIRDAVRSALATATEAS